MNKKWLAIILLGITSNYACKSETNNQEDTEVVAKGNVIENVDANTLNNSLTQNQNIQLIDVRTPGEFSSGTIAHAKNIDFQSADFNQKINELDKTQPVYIFCQRGGRSSDAANVMRDLGFTKVYNLDGGINSWKDQNLPVNNVSEKPTTSSIKTSEKMDYNTFLNVAAEKKNVVFDFYAEWCGPCKQMAPVLDELQRNSNGKFEIVKIDVDQSDALANHFKISSIPYLLVYKDGKQTAEIIGYEGEESLKNKVNSIFQ